MGERYEFQGEGCKSFSQDEEKEYISKKKNGNRPLTQKGRGAAEGRKGNFHGRKAELFKNPDCFKKTTRKKRREQPGGDKKQGRKKKSMQGGHVLG